MTRVTGVNQHTTINECKRTVCDRYEHTTMNIIMQDRTMISVHTDPHQTVTAAPTTGKTRYSHVSQVNRARSASYYQMTLLLFNCSSFPKHVQTKLSAQDFNSGCEHTLFVSL